MTVHVDKMMTFAKWNHCLKWSCHKNNIFLWPTHVNSKHLLSWLFHFLINWFILRHWGVLINQLSYIAYIFLILICGICNYFSMPNFCFPHHHTTWLSACFFPNQGSNPCLLLWKLGVLTTGPPGSSLHAKLLSSHWFQLWKIPAIFSSGVLCLYYLIFISLILEVYYGIYSSPCLLRPAISVGIHFKTPPPPHGYLKPWILPNPVCYTVLFLYVHSYNEV